MAWCQDIKVCDMVWKIIILNPRFLILHLDSVFLVRKA